MTTIATSLWFATEAEEAARLYCAAIPDAQLGEVVRTPPGGPGPEGAAMLVTFRIGGAACIAMNGNPQPGFTAGVSLVATCADQAELDRVWDALLAGGKPTACGWLQDRFGVAWQVVPQALPRLMGAGDAAQRGRVMAALMQMVKIDVAALEAAFHAT